MENKKVAAIVNAKAEAEAIRIIGAAEADVIKKKGKAEAEAIRAKGEAEADILEKKVKILQKYGVSVQTLTDLDAIEDITDPPKTEEDKEESLKSLSKEKKDYMDPIYYVLHDIQRTLYNAGCRNIDPEMSEKKAEVILAQAEYKESDTIYFKKIKGTLTEMLVSVESPFSIESFPLLKGIAPETIYAILMEIFLILNRAFPLASSKGDIHENS